VTHLFLMTGKVSLCSSDEQTFQVDSKVAFRSVLLKQMLEDIGETTDAIPLPNVTGKVLKKVSPSSSHYHRSLNIANTTRTMNLPPLRRTRRLLITKLTGLMILVSGMAST
jgi:hypothetical protein